MMQKIKSRIDRLLCREIGEIVAPISKKGTEITAVRSEGFGGHVSAKEFQESKRPEVFTPSTVIISGGYGAWNLEIPEDVRRSLVDMTLRIETIRTHGMLHTPFPNKSASIFVNDQLVDKIYLVPIRKYKNNGEIVKGGEINMMDIGREYQIIDELWEKIKPLLPPPEYDKRICAWMLG